jgi:hypothetical protein
VGISTTASFTVAALIGFAANSLLCRMALRPGHIDAASFTGIRLLSGAVVLAILARATRARTEGKGGGNWISAVALFAYAAAFSFAYPRIDAGAGRSSFRLGANHDGGVGWIRGERPRVLSGSGSRSHSAGSRC